MPQYRSEDSRKRRVQGNGPVVRFEVQERVGGPDEDGDQSWKVWSDHRNAAMAVEATRAVRAFLPPDRVRLAKVTTEIMEVDS